VTIGECRLILGDCLECLPLLTADAVVTDPPYGYNYESNHAAKTTTAAWMNTTIANDHDTSARDAVLTWADNRPWLSFGSWRIPKPAGVRGVLVWDKGPASGMGDLSFPWKGSWEEIYVGGKGWAGSRDEGVLKGHWVVTRASMGRTHPNEKPVSLMRELMKKLSRGCTVVDPFMGSGTTGVAAVHLGLRFVGVEMHRPYFDEACMRIENAYRQAPIFQEQRQADPHQNSLLELTA
jgi:DNA modification methylase